VTGSWENAVEGRQTRKVGALAQRYGVVSVLFDFSFTEFVTTRLVKAIYVLAVVLGGVLGLVGVAYALSRSLLLGLLAVLGASAVFAVFVLAVRICLEALLVVFDSRIMQPRCSSTRQRLR
jgi:hypothetical protein